MIRSILTILFAIFAVLPDGLRRCFAIVKLVDGRKLVLSDDGLGNPNSQRFTSWGTGTLVTFTAGHRAEAKSCAKRLHAKVLPIFKRASGEYMRHLHGRKSEQ